MQKLYLLGGQNVSRETSGRNDFVSLSARISCVCSPQPALLQGIRIEWISYSRFYLGSRERTVGIKWLHLPLLHAGEILNVLPRHTRHTNEHLLCNANPTKSQWCTTVSVNCSCYAPVGWLECGRCWLGPAGLELQAVCRVLGLPHRSYPPWISDCLKHALLVAKGRSTRRQS